MCVFVARAQPDPLISEPVSDKTDVLGRLKSLTPGPTISRLRPALDEAVKSLQKADENREFEIHILTDNQSLPWEELAPGGDSPLD